MSTLQSRLWRSLLLTLVISLASESLLWASLSSAAGAQFDTGSHTGSGVAGLDLAAIAINPFDLANLGISSSIILEGRYLSPESASSLVARSYRTSPESASKLISAYRANWGYTLALEIPGSGTDGNQQIVSTLFQVDGPDTASSLFAGLTAHTESGISVISSDSSVGDASQIVKYSSDQGSGNLIRTTQITFRSGSLVGIVSVSTRSSLGTTDRINAIARQLLQKIAIVSGGASPGISYRALRLRHVEPAVGVYIVSQGEVAQISGESGSIFRTRQQSDATVTIAYRQQMAVPSERPGTNLVIEISGFDVYDNASNWVFNAADRQRAIPGTSGVSVDTGATSLGDASTTLTYRTEDGRQARQITVRSGQYTFSIELFGEQMPPESAFETFAQAQFSCLQINAICNEVAIPSDLSPVEPTIAPAPTFPADSNAGASPIQVTPTATPQPSTPTPTPTSAPSPTLRLTAPTMTSSPPPNHDVRTITDATYPFAITYNPSEWTLTQQGTANNRSFVQFRNGTSDIYLVAGVAYGADINACLDDAHTGLQRETGVTGVMPARNREGAAVAGSSATDAYAVYTYRQTDGTSMARYLKCIVLEPKKSTLLIIQIVPGKEFNDQIDARNTLLSGLKIGTAP